MEHTKGEWILSNTHNFSGTYVIWLECNDKRIFSIRENSSNISLNQFEANARRIIQCTNSHDDLLAACKAIHKAIGEGNPVKIANVCVRLVMPAIAKAEKDS